MNPLCFGLEVMVLGARLCFGSPQIPQMVTIPVCPVASPRGRDFQRRLSAELRASASGSAVESALSEWLSLRDQTRACRSVR
jgi:hypothetical protein